MEGPAFWSKATRQVRHPVLTMRRLRFIDGPALVVACVFGTVCQAQQNTGAAQPDAVLQGSFRTTNAGHCADRSNYVLGPDDQITVLIPDLEELNGKQFRVDKDGQMQLPLTGRVNAGGLTTQQLGHEIEQALKRFVNKPEVVVTVADYRSQPVSVLGMVGTPGVYQVQGCKTLFEVLSLAGGLKPEAGDRIRVTRQVQWGRIPLPQVQSDPSGQFTVASIRVKSIMDASHPEENIAIAPNDVISVPKAELVYVVGAVNKPGGFVLGQDETISVLQVLSLAEGPGKTAASSRAKIMRSIPGTTRREEIPVNIAKLMAGKTANDLRMQANDILFVPDSAGKTFRAKTLDAAISALTGAAVYRPF
jgi:polysaccharide export outer membrane protein